MQTKILLVEDDIFLREGMTELFEKENYSVVFADSLKLARTYLSVSNFDLITLDVLLPDGNGLELCREIREKNILTPILFITACDDEADIVNGLDAGADDYITKPFRVHELLARIRSLLRRNSSAAYYSGELNIDVENMTVRKEGENIFLTPTEFQILMQLVKNRGVIVTRDFLLSNIWDNWGNFIDDNTLSVHVSRLREKIGSKHIRTVRGVGYRWEE